MSEHGVLTKEKFGRASIARAVREARGWVGSKWRGHTPVCFLKSVEGIDFEGDGDIPFLGVRKGNGVKGLRRGKVVDFTGMKGEEGWERMFTGDGSTGCVLCQHRLAVCYSNEGMAGRGEEILGCG